jgi:hypothetical protein
MEEKPQEQAETKNEANPPEVEEPKRDLFQLMISQEKNIK